MAATDDGGDKVILLCTAVSMFAMRVKMALSLKDVPYESRLEDIHQNKSSLLLEMNPVHKKIPVLIHNGKPVCESLIILEYVDDVWNHKSPSLLPSDPYKRARARFWAAFIDQKIYDSVRSWLHKTKDDKSIKEELVGNLQLLEGELGEGPYFGEGIIGFLDLVLVSYFTWVLAFENDVKLGIETECPKLFEWGKRCLQHEAISTSLAHPLKISEFVSKTRETKGR